MTLIIFCAACFADSSADRATKAPDDKTRSESGAIASKSTPYRVTEVGNGGAVHGRIEVDGAVPAISDAAVAAGADQAICGVSVVDESVVHTGSALGNVVVWVTDARQGHALPVDRRLEVVEEHCQLAPRVQAAIAGSTVNVRNQDAMVHRLLALREKDTIGVFRLSDEGQVVPSERLAKTAGLVAFGSDQHSWMRGWLAVFDHPYFAVSGPDGSYRIDSLAPGKYHLKAWHERGEQVIEEEFEIVSGKDALVDLKVKLK